MVSNTDISNMAYNLFESYDKDNSGFLEISELRIIIKELFKEVNPNTIISDERINKLFTSCDINGDKKLSRKEFGKTLALFLDPVYLNMNE